MSSIDLLNILDHSSTCSLSRCCFKNCNYMQQLAKHFISCNSFPSCKICEFMSGLTRDHAQKCSREQCMVEKCNKFKYTVICQSALAVELTSPELLEKSLFPCFSSNIIPAITVMEKCKIVKTEERDSDSGKIILPPWIIMEKSPILLLPKSAVKTVSTSSTTCRLAPKLRKPRTTKDSETKTLQKARRAAVFKERGELLLRKKLSVCSATCTSILGEYNPNSEHNDSNDSSHSHESTDYSGETGSSTEPSYITGSEPERIMLLIEETIPLPPQTPASSDHPLLKQQNCNRPAPSSYLSLPTPTASAEFIQRSSKSKEALTIILPGAPLLLEPIISLFQSELGGEMMVSSSSSTGDCDWMKNLLNGERLWL